MAKYSALVLTGEAFVDEDLRQQNLIISLHLGEGQITLTQTAEDINGKDVEHKIEIGSKAQAQALVQGIRGMAAALGWKV